MHASLLKDYSRAGLYYLPATSLETLRSAVAKAQQTLLLADVGRCTDSNEALHKLGAALHFPSWYGTNFDALHDCLTDPDWQPGKGLTLLISGLETLRTNDPDAFSTLIDVLRSAATIRSAEKLPLWILLTSPAPGVAKLNDA